VSCQHTAVADQLRITHPDRVLWPANAECPAVRKGDLLEYFAEEHHSSGDYLICNDLETLLWLAQKQTSSCTPGTRGRIPRRLRWACRVRSAVRCMRWKPQSSSTVEQRGRRLQRYADLWRDILDRNNDLSRIDE
jgi:hypothetical protein